MPRRTPPDEIRNFEPPYCPHRGCVAHGRDFGERFRFHRRGFQRIDRAPGWVRIFQCCHCRRYFRDSCFSGDYWKKVRGLLGPVFQGLVNGQANRQVARCLGVSRQTVDRRERELARQCLLRTLGHLRALFGQIDEPTVLDGLRCFAGSQYETIDVNTTATCESGFVLHVGAAPLRRSGSMTPKQKAVRAERDRRLGRPERGVRRRVTREAFQLIERLRDPRCEAEVRCDCEPDYPRALNDLDGEVSIRLVRVSSRRRRDESNPLWRINHLHRVIRHSLKSHVRETIAHHKCLRGLMDRMLILQFWINAVKGISERTKDRSRTTPAMLLGLETAPLDPETIFARRLFPERERLPESMRPLYEGRLKARPNEYRAVAEPVFAA